MNGLAKDVEYSRKLPSYQQRTASSNSAATPFNDLEQGSQSRGPQDDNFWPASQNKDEDI